MDTKVIASVVLKVTGLVLVALSVSQLPSYFPLHAQGSEWSPLEALLIAGLAVAPMAVLGMCLWFFPGTIANTIVAPSTLVAPFDQRGVLRIGLTVLGLYLIADGVSDVIYQVTMFILWRYQNPGVSFIPASIASAALAAAVKVTFGALFSVGGESTIRLLEKLRASN